MDSSQFQNTGQNNNFAGDVNDSVEEGIDIRRYAGLFISNWYWFAIALFISLSISYSINRWSEKVLTSSSSLLIKDDQIGGYAQIDPIFPGTESFKVRQNLKNEIGILKSYNLNMRVMDSLRQFHVEYVGVGRRGIAESRMYKNCPFVVVYDTLSDQKPGKRVHVKIETNSTYSLAINGDDEVRYELMFGEEFNNEEFNFKIVLRDSASFEYDEDASNKYYFSFQSPGSLANEYRHRLSVAPIDEDASLVVLSKSGNVAEQEADYLNMLMEVYLEWGLEVKNQTAEKTISFIEEQLDEIKNELEHTGDSLESFRKNNQFVDLGNEGIMIQEKLERLAEERSGLMFQADYLAYLQNYIEGRDISGDIIAPSMVGINDLVLEGTIEDLSALQQKERNLMLTLGPDMPAVRLAKSEVEKKINTLKAGVKSNSERIALSLDDVNSRISEVDRDISSLPAKERRLIEIQRDFDLNNTVYTYLLEKKAEAEIALASNVSDNRIIDYAVINNSVQILPREKRNRLIALILGIVIPAAGIVIIDLMNNKVIDRRDIEKATNVPVLGYISHNEFNSEIPVVSNPGSTFAESFRSVRTSLRYFTGDKEKAVISVASTVSSEGKTFISVNLAAILSMLGKKVLIVGLDLRKPRLHKLLDLSNSEGLSNYLIGSAKYDEVIFKTGIDNLWFTPSGPVPPNPAELIEGDLMEDFLKKAKEDFDYIILDTPPIAIVTDALLLAPFSDVTIFVVRQRYSSRNTLSLIQELYISRKFKNLSLIINDISLTGYYGYGLRYGYAMRYGGYNYGYSLYGDYAYTAYGYGKDGKDYYSE